MKRGWQAAVAVLLVVFAFFAFESLRLSLRDALGPGPGFFPFWLSVAGGVLAVVLLVQLHRESESEPLNFDRAGLRGVAMVLAGLIVATALLEVLGFRIAMLLLLVYLLVALGVRNWIAIGLVAVAGSFGVFHVFSGLLKVQLP
ncbi:MAG TPA: tripartite tricarboxylate transporter TctB family protein [Burkholderiales bacterium]|nr:tripartite tricarboxylate transporter TctB family protein [Burkholderiales bacterium]